MTVRCLLAFGLGFFASPTLAETLIAGPDPCPVAATMPLVIDLGELDGAQVDAAQDEASHVMVIYAPIRVGWARQRLLARFEIDPEARQEAAEAQIRPCMRKVN